MRILCMFDLPTNSRDERRAYRDFRKYLISNGFQMLQYSVYIRTCPNRSSVNKYFNRIKANAPKKGNIKLMYITEKQYEDMLDIVCQDQQREKILGPENVILI